MRKTLINDSWRIKHKLILSVFLYDRNGNMGIPLWEDGEPFDTLTTNFARQLPVCQVYINRNHMPNICTVLEELNLAKFTREKYSSPCSYCTYPIYEFNMDVLTEYNPENVEIYKQSIR